MFKMSYKKYLRGSEKRKKKKWSKYVGAAEN
jgi:hypothetical protein